MTTELSPIQLRILKFLAAHKDWATRAKMSAEIGHAKGFSKALGAPTNPPIKAGTLEDLEFVERKEKKPPYEYRITEPGKNALSAHEANNGEVEFR